tara:strand:- start:1862 stop:2314 length:453 start_codon:yes stop_codon:yes gene_type:complete
MSIKKRIISAIIDKAYAIDKFNGKVDKYERGFYCGEHKTGHTGQFTESHYHEGEGGMSATFGCISFSEDTDGVSMVSLFNPLKMHLKVRFNYGIVMGSLNTIDLLSYNDRKSQEVSDLWRLVKLSRESKGARLTIRVYIHTWSKSHTFNI